MFGLKIFTPDIKCPGSGKFTANAAVSCAVVKDFLGSDDDRKQQQTARFSRSLSVTSAR